MLYENLSMSFAIAVLALGGCTRSDDVREAANRDITVTCTRVLSLMT